MHTHNTSHDHLVAREGVCTLKGMGTLNQYLVLVSVVARGYGRATTGEANRQSQAAGVLGGAHKCKPACKQRHFSLCVALGKSLVGDTSLRVLVSTSGNHNAVKRCNAAGRLAPARRRGVGLDVGAGVSNLVHSAVA